MEDIISSILAVKNTLEEIEIKATLSNMEKLYGCQQVLDKVMESLKKEAENGHDHAE